jgi:hypothetical protein
MKKRNAIILLLLAGILAFRCDPEGPDTEQYINLEIPLAIRPQQDTFQLGDTLWLEADFPDSLLFTPVSGSISARVLSFLT